MIFTQAELASDIERWRELFNSKWKLSTNGSCWVWQAAVRVDSYGQFHIRRHSMGAHRASYILFKGDLPPNQQVCHTCDTPRCVNPEHLYLAAPAQNSADMVARGRSLKGEKHHQAKLTNEMVLEIRKMEGTSGYVAKHFGVDSSLIRMIRRRDIWRHI